MLTITDTTEMTTPQLVREFADHRVDAALGLTTAASHKRLGEVVDELRRRNVLN